MSDSAKNARLWFTPDRSRFFLVPDGPMPRASAPDGELAVRSLHATSAAVDAEWIATHEVDAAAARAHVDAGWEDVVGQLRDTWRSLATALSGAAGTPAPADDEAERQPDLARWLGVTPGEVVTDPDKRRQGKRTLIERAARLVKPGATAEDIDRFEARLDRVGEAVQRDAERLRTESERLAQSLNERRPDLEAAAQDAGQQVVDLGRAALDRLRGVRPTEPAVEADDADPEEEPADDAEGPDPASRRREL